AREYAFVCAVTTDIKQTLPELRSFVRCGIDLEAVFARVACARDDRRHIVNRTFTEMIILDLCERRVGQLLHDAERVGALDGELAEVCAAVFEFGLFIAAMRVDPIPVFVSRRSVDD